MFLHMLYGFLIGVYLTIGVFIAHDIKESVHTVEKVPDFIYYIWIVIIWGFKAIYIHLEDKII